MTRLAADMMRRHRGKQQRARRATACETPPDARKLRHIRPDKRVLSRYRARLKHKRAVARWLDWFLYEQAHWWKVNVVRAYEWLVHKEPSWLTSFCCHALLLIVLALLLLPSERKPIFAIELRTAIDEPIVLEDIEPVPIASPLLVDDLPPALEVAVSPELLPEPEIGWNLTPGSNAKEIEPPPPAVGRKAATAVPSVGVPGGLTGRLQRREQAELRGATPESEQAVDRALKWLAAHQDYDGGWTFDLTRSRCKGQCHHAGTAGVARNAATALGLLPFLGAGHPAQRGTYSHVVSSAVKYLISHQASDGSFYEPEGTMYSHGLATLALCELLAMSGEDDSYASNRRRDNQRLRYAAQRAVDVIVRSQHSAGGWRYEYGQPGDTSVVGWQAMALQSGRMAGLDVPKETFSGITRFLDSVSADNYGATYGYQDRLLRPGTTAVGLLCRMYLGWDRNHPGMVNGAEHLSRGGPSSNNMYFDYYATQVMHHYQGPLWERWNAMLRDHLVQTQVQSGHESGSWYFEGDFGSNAGGRLYITALSAMILEVYYRHMPIYSSRAVAQTPQAVP